MTHPVLCVRACVNVFATHVVHVTDAITNTKVCGCYRKQITSDAILDAFCNIVSSDWQGIWFVRRQYAADLARVFRALSQFSVLFLFLYVVTPRRHFVDRSWEILTINVNTSYFHISIRHGIRFLHLPSTKIKSVNWLEGH